MVSEASAALAYYNGILEEIVNPSIFLILLKQKKQFFPQYRGTITTVDEVLKFEVDIKPDSISRQNDIIEVLNYRKATRAATEWLKNKLPFLNPDLCHTKRINARGSG